MYSRQWFETFLYHYSEEITERDCSFVDQLISRFQVKRYLDICCGDGRHLLNFIHKGLDLYGVDLDRECLNRLAERDHTGSIKTYLKDMRELPSDLEKLCLITNLWQSFGQFSENENKNLLLSWKERLKSGGILLLDIYNKDFYLSQQLGSRLIANDEVEEISSFNEGRLEVRLNYKGGKNDSFSWQLYSPDEIEKLGKEIGFKNIEIYTDFDFAQKATALKNRMQVVMF